MINFPDRTALGYSGIMSPYRNLPLDLRHLYAFLAVAEEGHFGRAAARLGVTQPLLSMRIRSLEAMVRQALLERRPKVVPTAAGRAFETYARQAIAALEQGMAASTRAAEGLAGSLAIGFPTWALSSPVPEAIISFQSRYPDVELRLNSYRSIRQLEEVERGNMQIGFLRDFVPGPAFEFAPIHEERWVLAVPQRHRLAGRNVVSLAELDGEDFFVPDSESLGTKEKLLALVAQAGATPRTLTEFGTFLQALSLVSVGAAVALVPSGQQELWRKGIDYLGIEEEGRTQINAVWLANSKSALVGAFVEILLEFAGPRASEASSRSSITR